MAFYYTCSAILMALLLFCSQLKTVHARFPFGVRNIVNEDPEQYESDLKRDMGMMPRTHFVYVNGEPEVSERYRQISGEVEKANIDEKYDNNSLKDTKPLEHHNNIKNEPEELDRKNSSEYDFGRIVPPAYDLKDSVPDNMYYHENYGRNISNDVGNIVQLSYRAAVGRELEDLSNEHDDDSYENWQSESEENNYDENSENEGELMGMRRTVHTKNQQTQTSSIEENDDVDSADWSSPAYDENTETEGNDYAYVNMRRNAYTANREPEYDNDDENSGNEDEDDVDENSDDEEGTPRQAEPKMVEDYMNEDDSSMNGADLGELSSPRRGGLKTSSACANSGGECKVKCHKSLQYGNRGCGKGQVCCLVAYKVVALY